MTKFQRETLRNCWEAGMDVDTAIGCVGIPAELIEAAARYFYRFDPNYGRDAEGYGS